MSNGNHALQLVTSEPACPVDKPVAVASQDVGAAVAAATAALYCALTEYRERGFLDKTRLMVGERTAEVAMLMLAYEGGDVDFETKARAAARPILRRQLEGQYTPAQGDRVVDFYLDELLKAVSHVVASERKFVAAMMN
jgi:hypothetical protein